jgi:hypothetical protein
MSIRLTGLVNYLTGNNNLIVNQATCSASFFARVNASVPVGGTMRLFMKQGPNCINAFVNLGNSIDGAVYPSSGAALSASKTDPNALVYHFALSYQIGTQIWYINGVPALTGTSTFGTQNPTGKLQLGNEQSSTGDVEICDLALWNGYALTAMDVLNLMFRNSTPAQISTPATSWWTLAGTVGNNPAINDAGLTDQMAAGNNFTTLAGTNTLATYTAHLNFTPLMTTTPILARDGQTVYFLFNENYTGLHVPQSVGAVNSNPTIYVNGTQTSITGPVWRNSVKDTAWVAYQLSSKLQNTDVLTYTASFNWATAGGNPAINATTAPVTNSTGVLEPQVGNWSAGLPVAPWNPATKTMPIGMNMNWPTSARKYGSYWLMQNLIHRAGNNFTNTTYNTDGFPTALTASPAVSVLVNGNQSNDVDPKLCVCPPGVYTFTANETAPGTPMTVSLTGNANATISAATITRGTITGGIEYGKRWQWTVAYSSGNPTTWDMNLALNLTAAGGGAGSQTLHQSGMSFTGPFQGGAAQTPMPNTAYADQQVVASVTTSKGKGPYIIRAMDSTANFDGISNVVDYADAQLLSYFAWNSSVNIGGQPSTWIITEIRPYSVTNSPYVYTEDSWNGTAASAPGGSPGPYRWSPSSTSWYSSTIGNGTAYFEVVTSAAHGMKTGQLYTFPSSATLNGIVFHFSNGNFTTTNMSLNNSPVWVTSATTFVTDVFVSVSANGAGTPNIDNTGLSIAGSSVFAPDTATVPEDVHAAACQQSGALVWLSIPFFATPACAQSYMTAVLNQYTGKGAILFQLGNEMWSSQKQGNHWYSMLANLTAQTGGWQGMYITRSDQIRTALKAAVSAAGRGNQVKMVLSAQPVTGGNTQSYCTTAASLGIAFDYIATGNYMYQTGSGDSTIQQAGLTWSVGSLVDLHRWWMAYNTQWNGTVGIIGDQLAKIQQYYTLAGPKPQLCAYESAIQSFFNSGTANSIKLSHDAWYHPYAYDVFTTEKSVEQTNGVVFSTHYAYCGPLTGNGIVWWIYRWQGQQAGRGDGSDAKVVNQYATTQGTLGVTWAGVRAADGHAHDGPDGINPLGNVSVWAQAWLDWAQAANPSPAGNAAAPAQRRWFPRLGGRRLVSRP